MLWDSASDVEDINRLLRQLSRQSKRATAEWINQLLARDDFFLIDEREDGRMVAMATLLVEKTLGDRFGILEDVVVGRKYRGRGLGEKLVRRAIRLAQELHLSSIELTSRPSRRAANKLYRKLGFKKRNTNCYRLNLS